MSNVNDNNLDDLLRRAAEKYPLRTDSANWERLASDLERDPSLILPPLNAEDRRRRRRFFWLFFLLPLAGAGYYVWHGTGKSSLAQHSIEQRPAEKTAIVNGNATNEKEAGVKTAPITGTLGERSGPVKENINQWQQAGGKVTPTGKNPVEGKNPGEVEKGNAPTEQKTIGAAEKEREGAGQENAASAKKIAASAQNIAASAQKNTSSGQKNAPSAQKNALSGLKNKPSVQKNAASEQENASAFPKDAGAALNSHFADASLRIAGGKVERAPTKGKFSVNYPVQSNSASLANTAKKDKIKLQKPKPSFYVGILGSPDLSTIKFQSIKNTGSNFGLLLGYSFNSRWAVETGLYYDRKKYYTNGEYFSKKNVPGLYDVDLQKVDGVCNMWEIPLNLRYNFPSGGKIKWFGTAGLSTYLMSKETYTYAGTRWGTPWGGGTWTYKKPYHYAFSIIDFSFGFEEGLGKIGNLRLEPFARVPLSGIGTGNLSIMSAGLNIGITRKLW